MEGGGQRKNRVRKRRAGMREKAPPIFKNFTAGSEAQRNQATNSKDTQEQGGSNSTVGPIFRKKITPVQEAILVLFKGPDGG